MAMALGGPKGLRLETSHANFAGHIKVPPNSTISTMNEINYFGATRDQTTLKRYGRDWLSSREGFETY